MAIFINGTEIDEFKINTETLSGNKTLVLSDKIVQWLDPNGADRNITLPAEAQSGDIMFIILNTADGIGEDLLVYDDTPTLIATLGPGMSGMFSCDGTAWKWESELGVFYDKINTMVGIGNIELENTISDHTGVIYKSSDRFIHNFQHPTGGGAIPVGKNTFVGVNAGNFTMGSTATSTVFSSLNSAVGVDALTSNTTGYDNSALGAYALTSNTTGYYNSAVGRNALRWNTTGRYNSALGLQALFGNTIGFGNTALGADALVTNTEGYHNTAVGMMALYYNTTGYGNVCIGYMAGDEITTGNYNIIIGYNVDAPSPTGDNQLNIGNLLIGNTALGTMQLGGTLDSNVHQIRLAKGADVASANALTLGTDGNYFDITGTTAITSIGTLGIGTTVTLHFDGILTLTHHATDLILPGAVNIVTAAGDEATFVEYAAGDWRCIGYTQAAGIRSPQVNLLSNSGFGVWSNATLENVGSNLVASWINSTYETFTSVGADITSAIETGVAGAASSAAITLESGKLYKIVATLTLNSGEAPSLAMTNLGHATVALSAGANTFIREATSTTTTLTMSNTAASNYSCTFTLYEVTPGCVAADALACDGMLKTASVNTKIYREHYNPETTTKYGSFYSLKLVAAAASFAKWTLSGYNFSGRKITFGAWCKSSVAGSRVNLYDGINDIYSGVNTANEWTWLELTITVRDGASSLQVILDTFLASTAYWSQPMLVFGSSIGQGNYVAPPDEVIYCETAITSILFDGTGKSDAADSTLKLEADSSGKIPKGVKSIAGFMTAKDSGSAANECYITLQHGSGKDNQIVQVGYLAPDDRNVRVPFDVKCDANGDILYDIEATGSLTFDPTMKITKVVV